MIRKKNLYLKPKKSFESTRIREENVLLNSYALKNKREIWKTLAKVNYLKNRAKALAKSSPEEQQVLFNKLNALCLKTNLITDVLDLKVEDILNRRLPTIVAKKKLTTTIKQARQLITHKKILVNGRVVNTPSYLVSLAEEDKITTKEKKKKPQPKGETEQNELQSKNAEVMQ